VIQDLAFILNIRRTIKPVFFIFSIFILSVHQSNAESRKTFNPEEFFSYDPYSKISINYENWTSLLKATVVRARVSSREYSRRPGSGVGTRVKLSNPNPSRMETSRVLFGYLKEEHIDYIHNLRLAMQSLPRTIDLQSLNRKEQLAFWLNLYNITLYEQLAKRYPITRLKRLRMGKRNKTSLWDEKILTIKGMAVSLNDIQYKIIHKIWPDPIVLYGLYHGTIGGPNLYHKAYTGKNVYQLLELNAEEFVNSLRGLRFRGKDALTSKMYQWNHEFFPDFETDLIKHLRKYTNFELTTRLDSSRKIKASVYDWYLTDVIKGNGSTINGSVNTNPVAMILSGYGRNLPHTGKAWDTSIDNIRTQNNPKDFLKNFMIHNTKNATKITIEEVSKEELKKIKQKVKSEKVKDKEGLN